jgi:glycosyltransferase involved in cell wall biosynthesis
MPTSAPALWFDVDDLFRSVHRDARLTDGQRVAIEVYRVFERTRGNGGPVRFVRMNEARTALVVVGSEEVFRVIGPAPQPAAVPGAVAVRTAEFPSAVSSSGFKVTMKRALSRLPERVQRPLRSFAALQIRALQALRRSAPALGDATTVLRRCWLPLRGAAGRMSPRARRTARFEDMARPGDVLMMLGAPSWQGRYGEMLARLRARNGLRFILLVHDILPLVHPDWFDRVTARACREWHLAVLPHCDALLVGLQATADALRGYCMQAGLQLPVEPKLLRLGSSLSLSAITADDLLRPAALPPAEGYVLCVGPIEARTNHSLLLRVWRRMTEQRKPDAVPMLVFAGRIGWLVADLVQQLRNADYLDGKIRLITDAGEADLERLYNHCLFTVSASLHEGTPLSVTESLARCKPCVASFRAAPPEAEALVRRFDPENLADAYATICEMLDHPEPLAALQRRVVSSFRAVTWDETAASLVAAAAA